MIEKGTYWVRTIGFKPPNTHGKIKGDIVITTSSSKESIRWDNRMISNVENFRKATEFESILYDFGVRSIHQDTRIILVIEDVSASIIIQKYMFEQNYTWHNNSVEIKKLSTIGINPGDKRLYNFTPTSPDINLVRLIEIINNNKNNQNEQESIVPRENQSNSKPSVIGRAIVSSISKQITTGIRPVGNTTSVVIKKARVESAFKGGQVING